MKKVWLVLGLMAIGIVLAACVPLMETPVPTQDVNAAVQTAVAEALRTAPQTPTPVIDATIQAGIQATITAQPAPAPIPIDTPTPRAPCDSPTNRDFPSDRDSLPPSDSYPLSLSNSPSPRHASTYEPVDGGQPRHIRGN